MSVREEEEEASGGLGSPRRTPEQGNHMDGEHSRVVGYVIDLPSILEGLRSMDADAFHRSSQLRSLIKYRPFALAQMDWFLNQNIYP